MSDNFDDKLAHPEFKNLTTANLAAFISLLAPDLDAETYKYVLNYACQLKEDMASVPNSVVCWNQLADFISGCIANKPKIKRKERKIISPTTFSLDDLSDIEDSILEELRKYNSARETPDYTVRILELPSYNIETMLVHPFIKELPFVFQAQFLMAPGAVCLEDAWKVIDSKSPLFLFGSKLLYAIPSLYIKEWEHDGTKLEFVYSAPF